MYRVTLQAGPSERISLRVANQDLGRILSLAGRLRYLNPAFEVSYEDDSRERDQGAA